MVDNHTNFGYSTVSVAPSPGISGTTLEIGIGDDSLFPTVPFNIVVWPSSTQPLATNAEILRVTNKTGNLFTIVREQEGTTARDITIGDQVSASITVKTFTDIEDNYIPSAFETLSNNLKDYAYTVTYSGDDVNYITYDLGGGLEIIKTFNYTSGDITSIVLSGDTPAGVNLTKTISYTGSNISSVSYS